MKVMNQKTFNENNFNEFLKGLVELRGESDEIVRNDVFNKTIVTKVEDQNQYLFTVKLNETLDLTEEKQFFQLISNHEMKIVYMYLNDLKDLIKENNYKYVFLVDMFLNRKLLVYTKKLFNVYDTTILTNNLYNPVNDDYYDYFEVVDLIEESVKNEQNEKLKRDELDNTEGASGLISRIVNQIKNEFDNDYSLDEIGLNLFDFYLDKNLSLDDLEKVDYKFLELTGDNSIQNLNKVKNSYLKLCEKYTTEAKHLNDEINDNLMLHETLDDLVQQYIDNCQKLFFYSQIYSILDQLYMIKLRGGLEL